MICPACDGRGQNKDTKGEHELKFDAKGRCHFITHKLGSGCPRCLGVGKVDDEDFYYVSSGGAIVS